MGGKKTTLKLQFVVSDCTTEAFSVSMSSKVPGSHTDLSMRLRRFDSPLKSAEFTLSRLLSFKPKRGNKIGTMILTDEKGKRQRKSLMYPRKGRTLYKGSQTSVRLGKKNRKSFFVDSVPEDTETLEIKLIGKSAHTIKNSKKGCGTKNKYKVSATFQNGKKQTLKRSLIHCKGKSQAN